MTTEIKLSKSSLEFQFIISAHTLSLTSLTQTLIRTLEITITLIQAWRTTDPIKISVEIKKVSRGYKKYKCVKNDSNCS